MSKSGYFLQKIGENSIQSESQKSVDVCSKNADVKLNLILEGNKLVLLLSSDLDSDFLKDKTFNFDSLYKFNMLEFLMSNNLDIEIKDVLNEIEKSIKNLEKKLKYNLIECLSKR